MSLRVFLMEDEPPALARLERALVRCDPSVVVAGTAASTREAVAWLRANPEPDLVFADIRLSDGLSLRVFEEVPLRSPVVFTTAYDAHVQEALERNAIDYLLKPIEDERLARALAKYSRLREHFGGKLATLAASLGAPASPGRVLARKGAGFVAVPLEQVAWFTTQYKQTVVVQRGGARLLVDEPLGDLEARLAPEFFRLNRQYLARAAAVVSFESAGHGRMVVTLEPRTEDDVVVSQEMAGRFREWVVR
jgi:DNA-binding LytR/AlgR family response regulator